MLPGAGCCFGRRKDEVEYKERWVPFTSGKDERQEWKVRVMGERKWTWRSWTVREEKDAIIDKERGREVNVTFGAGSIVLAGGEGIGLARRGFWEGREGGGGCKWRGDGWVRCLPDWFAWPHWWASMILEVMAVPWDEISGTLRKPDSNFWFTPRASE